MLEKDLHKLVAKYLKVKHPKVIFRTDFAAGMKMSMFMARKHNALQSSRAYPDLFIAESRKGFSGLFIEIKREDTVVFKKDGTIRKNEHLIEQHEMLKELELRNYKAVFGIGYENITKIIDEYLNSY
jgi:hypothetical protein